jgi:hypothetical protein
MVLCRRRYSGSICRRVQKLERSINRPGRCRRFRVLDLDPGFRRARAIRRIQFL